MFEVWRRVHRPFRVPKCCKGCTWEVFDVDKAGCLRCGAQHLCYLNSVDNKCPLVEVEDHSRVCSITGAVLNEVRVGRQEFSDTTSFVREQDNHNTFFDDVYSAVNMILSSSSANACRETENKRLCAKLHTHMYKQMKQFKLQNPGRLPNVCHILAAALSQEKYWRFMEKASSNLINKCTSNVHACLRELQLKNVKLVPGTRIRDLVCGILYMLKHGLVCRNKILLQPIPEIEKCLPHENKIEIYFGISSKVICMTENEIKYVFRDAYQS